MRLLKRVLRVLRQLRFLSRHHAEMSRLANESHAIFKRAMAEKNREQFDAYVEAHKEAADRYFAILDKIKSL